MRNAEISDRLKATCAAVVRATKIRAETCRSDILEWAERSDENADFAIMLTEPKTPWMFTLFATAEGTHDVPYVDTVEYLEWLSRLLCKHIDHDYVTLKLDPVADMPLRIRIDTMMGKYCNLSGLSKAFCLVNEWGMAECQKERHRLRSKMTKLVAEYKRS